MLSRFRPGRGTAALWPRLLALCWIVPGLRVRLADRLRAGSFAILAGAVPNAMMCADQQASYIHNEAGTVASREVAVLLGI